MLQDTDRNFSVNFGGHGQVQRAAEPTHNMQVLFLYHVYCVIHSLFCGYEFALHERVTLRKTRPRDHGLHRPPTLPEERVRVVTFEAPSKRPRILFRVGTNNRNAQVQLSHMAPVHRAIDDATGH